MVKLDKKDGIILNILQKNCRAPLTAIAKEVGLSLDSVKKRINKMLDSKIFYPRIQLRPRNFGFVNIVDVKIKIQNYSEEDVNRFIAYLKQHPRVTEVFSIAGEWDISIVLIAKDAIDLGKLTSEIRHKFGKIISSWSESVTTNSHKFEEYDMIELLENNFNLKK